MQSPLDSTTNIPSIVEAAPVPTLREHLVQHGPLNHAIYEEMKRHTRCWRDTLLLMFLRNTGLRPFEVVRVEARHLGREGPIYYVMIKRAKKRKVDLGYQPIYLNPNLGQPLVAYAQGANLKPSDGLFGVKERQLREITYQVGEKAIGRRVMPKEFRRLYSRTVAPIAAQVLGFAPQHMEVAQKMMGHERVNTTWDWYYELTPDEQREIQERISV